jgi:iron complex outermembrane receptor protein
MRVFSVVSASTLVASALASVAAPAAADSFDEVVVTATRRETKLMATPISMTVLAANTLQTVNADDFADFARLVPGLTAIDSGPGNKRYALRGLQSAGEPEVALYYDEIPISGIPGGSLDTGDSQPDIKLWDVDRIEVLRGPQGTLYGNGSMGGTLRIISKRPVLDRFEGEAEASEGITAGGAASWRLNGMVNAPLVADKVAVRATAYYRHEGGWIDDPPRADIALPQLPGNNLNTERTWGGRVSATLKATDQWTLTGIGYYQDLETDSSFETYPSFATSGDPYVSKTFVHTPWSDESRMFNLISTYDLGWASLVGTGSYQDRTVKRSLDTTRFLLGQFKCNPFTWDLTCFGPPLVPAVSYSREEVSASSGEIRLVSQHPGALQWTLGSFIQRAKTSRAGQVATADANGRIEFDPATGDALHRLFARDNGDRFNQYALFGEGTYEIGHRLQASVGLRWFHSDRSDQQVVVQQFFPGQPVGPEPLQQFQQSALFKKLELSYQPAPGRLLYVEASQGFRSGGPNYPGGFTATAPPYKADSVWDYEVGWKASFAQHRLNWTGALFYIDWSDLQQLVPTALFSYIANAGSAKAEGFETELDAQPLPGLEVTLGATYTNATLVGPQPLQTDPTVQLHSGQRLANVPQWTSNAGVTYSVALNSRYTAVARVDYTYQSSRGNIVATQSPLYFTIASSSLTALHIALNRGDAWSVLLHANNLLNRFAPLSAKELDSNNIQTVTAARPRTVMLSVNTKF